MDDNAEVRIGAVLGGSGVAEIRRGQVGAEGGGLGSPMENQHSSPQVHLDGGGKRGMTSEELMRQFLHREASQGDQEMMDRTSQRFTDAFREMMGINDGNWSFTVFESECDEMIIVKDMTFVSLCEHHLFPFTGTAHVSYIPQGKIAGLSKIARTVRGMSRGLWTQEHLTIAIADFLTDKLGPLGVGVVMEAEHTCMTIRGVKAPGSKTITSAMRGVYRDNNNNARAEFLGLLRG